MQQPKFAQIKYEKKIEIKMFKFYEKKLLAEK
jgi:hypothetical protein